jgi:N-acetylneuraminic acid mutarotase
MADSSRSSSSSKTKTVRSQKIQLPSPADEQEESLDRTLPIRSHTPGYVSSKSQSQSHSHSRRKGSEPSIRQRAQSVSTKASYAPPAVSYPSLSLKTSIANGDAASTQYTPGAAAVGVPASAVEGPDVKRPVTMRSTSAIASKPNTSQTTSHSRKPSTIPRPRGPYAPFPPLQEPKSAPDVPPAPSSGMYWSRAPTSGASHTPLRAHTMTLVGNNIFVFGGCDSRACFNELYVFDADSFHWSTPHVVGELPAPLRAMTCTAVGKKLVIFGGGDGPAYFNDVYVLDTVNFRWQRPRVLGDRSPSARRAHTACLYKSGIYVFGGGDGVRALNDVWRLDVADMNKLSWNLVSGPSTSESPSRENKPKARGYHTANMVGSKLIIYGGSDGGECFNDVWVYDVETHVWKSVTIPITFRRLSHTATIVGSYLFVVGGHDGSEYSNDVLLLNLVTMTWDKRRVYGAPPSGRGYHGTVLHDSRLITIGGFDGGEVFSDVWILELAVHAYYSQISHFTIDV